MEPGTYTLLLELLTDTTIEFGAAGPRELSKGYYAYNGSAFGPGGLSRVERHRRVAVGDNTTRQWHVDYLLGATPVVWVTEWTAADHAVECAIANSLDAEAIKGIGATDCECVSHLHFSPSREPLVRSIEAAYADPGALGD